jgi:hypothetical protein
MTKQNHHDRRHSIVFGMILLLSALCLSGCMSAPTQTQYDENSWKTMIADSCQSFFDGCNNCRRSPGSEVIACTRMACEIYTKPFCRDKATVLPQ